jgi:signal transduction histidine kinase
MRSQKGQRLRGFPDGVFLTAVSIVCAGLAASAFYSFLMLSDLRDQYLEKLGHDISTAIDVKTRGPGRRDNIGLWQSVLDESLQTNRGRVAFLLLYEETGKVLASAGEYPSDVLGQPAGSATLQQASIYLFEERVPTPQRAAATPHAAGWWVRAGLYTSMGAFIMKQAYTQLAIAAIAIIALAGLAFYFLRAMRRVFELKSREAAERHLASLGRMSATLAHEIRNPLGAMKGLSQVAQENLPADHETQALLHTVVSEAERLEQLVGDLLTFARPPEPQITRFDLNRLIKEVTGMMAQSIDRSGIKIDPITGPGELIVRSDENGLRQVLLNVVLNAIAATPEGGTVRVSAKPRNEAQRVEILVEDTGPGLGGRDPEELFQPFTTTKAKGSGLGLAISRQIIERLGGRIALSNGQPAGARCAIRLPLAKESR